METARLLGNIAPADAFPPQTLHLIYSILCLSGPAASYVIMHVNCLVVVTLRHAPTTTTATCLSKRLLLVGSSFSHFSCANVFEDMKPQAFDLQPTGPPPDTCCQAATVPFKHEPVHYQHDRSRSSCVKECDQKVRCPVACTTHGAHYKYSTRPDRCLFSSKEDELR